MIAISALALLLFLFEHFLPLRKSTQSLFTGLVVNVANPNRSLTKSTACTRARWIFFAWKGDRLFQFGIDERFLATPA